MELNFGSICEFSRHTQSFQIGILYIYILLDII